MTNTTLYHKKKRVGEGFILAAVYGAAGVAVFLLLGIIGYVFVKGSGTLSLKFLTTVTSSLKNTVGIAGNLVNTIYIIILTLLIATPIGVNMQNRAGW